MRYIIFSRVSTNMQDTENQLFEINNYLDTVIKPGDEVLRFDEKAKSTRLEMDERPILKAMLDEIKKGDTVLVYKLNRLARGHELALIHHLITKRAKAQIVSLYEKDINDELIHAYAMVGAFERKNIRDNTITALKNKQSKFEKVGTVWYGYQLDSTVLQQNKRARTFDKPYKLIPHPKEQEALAIMRDMYSTNHSYQEIADTLTNFGYLSRSGKPFLKGSVHRILKRELNHPARQDALAQSSLAIV